MFRLQRYFNGTILTKTRLDRVLAVLVLLMLAVQLLGMGQHKDDHTGAKADCASCFFAHQLPSGLPDVAPVAAPVLGLASYPLLRFVTHDFHARTSFLIPQSQAPPRRLSLSA